ncbi:hypothetical protein ACFLU5_08335 [Bacteroidota bacterium]
MVKNFANIARKSDEFILAIAPEGTRKEVHSWKTGFYYIAREAEIPVIMASMDFKLKKVSFSNPFYTSDDTDSDMKFIKRYFKDAKGLRDLKASK